MTEYRNRAGTCGDKAAMASDEETRKTLLRTADTWERMAQWEDKHHPERAAAVKLGHSPYMPCCT